MKYWISLVTTVEVDQFVEIAKFAEQLGFEGITVADHLVVPTKVETAYPYTPDGAMWWPTETPWPDPWVTLAGMGTATSRIKLGSNIYLAPLRDPFTAARAIGTCQWSGVATTTPSMSSRANTSRKSAYVLQPLYEPLPSRLA